MCTGIRRPELLVLETQAPSHPGQVGWLTQPCRHLLRRAEAGGALLQRVNVLSFTLILQSSTLKMDGEVTYTMIE